MKNLYALTLGFALALSFEACTDQDFDEKYYDPSKTTTVTCDKMFTGTLMAGNNYTFNAYWRMYTWDHNFGKLAQTIGFNNNSGSVYFINDGYANDRWNGFYNILAQFRVLQDTYARENATKQAEDKIFVDMAEVFLYDHLSQIVDLFGPAPFTKAGYLGITGNLASSYPAYDSDVDLYKMMLTRLDELYTDIQSIKSSGSFVQTQLTAQDYLNKGDLDKWIAYANSLRLRLGIHVAAQGDLTSEGRAAIASAAGRPLVTTWDNSIKVESDYDGFNYWENFRDAFKDINYTASQRMIDAMQITGEDDPRLAVMYTPREDGKYFGKATSETDAEQNERDTYSAYKDRYYAHLDSATFVCCNDLVSPVFSASEAYFLLAEAYQQGYATGDAKEAFKKGILESVKQYYAQNMKSDHSKLAVPATTYIADKVPEDDAILAYADKVWDAYPDKFEGIMTQKWLHFGIMQAPQAWTDIRRTGYPVLDYPEDGQSQAYKTIIQRIKYPNTEMANNKANYEANKANVDGDSAYFTLFWAKTLK